MNRKRLKIAVLGCGHWGKYLIKNFSTFGDCEIVLAVDIDLQKLRVIKKLFPKIEITKNISDCLSKNLCDALAISLPVSLHYQMAKEALNGGKHVFCEKPLAQSVSQTQDLLDLAKKKNKVLFTDYTMLYSNEVNYLKKLCRSLKYKFYTFDSRRLSFGLFRQDVDVVYDLAPHDLAILIYLFGKPKEVIAWGKAHVNGNFVDDAHLLAFYPNELVAQIHVSWLFPQKVRDITIVTNKKMIFYDDTRAQDKIEITAKAVSLKALSENYLSFRKNFVYKYQLGKIERPRIPYSEPLRLACQEFLNQVKGKKPDFGVELEVAQVLEALSLSLKRGRLIKLLN
jgi:predicted dehydrogenase